MGRCGFRQHEGCYGTRREFCGAHLIHSADAVCRTPSSSHVMVLTEYFAVLIWFVLLMLYTELRRPVISIFSPAGWTNMQQAKTGCHVLFEFNPSSIKLVQQFQGDMDRLKLI
jgi:hypothetical protein